MAKALDRFVHGGTSVQLVPRAQSVLEQEDADFEKDLHS